MKSRLPIGAMLLFATSGVMAQAVQELEYSVRVGAAYSDNVERRPSGLEESASAAVVGVAFSGERTTGRLRYDLDTDVSYNEYLSSDVDSEVLGRAGVHGAYFFVPETFSWNAGLDYDQLRSDLLRPLAPGNLTDQLSLSTGPSLRLRFSNTLEGQIDSRFTRLNYGEGADAATNQYEDNDTLSARALLGRRANPRSLLALGGSWDDVNYDAQPLGTPDFDFKRREAFVRMELTGARTTVELETGYAKITGDTTDDSNLMLRSRLSRRLTPSLTGFVRAVREYPTVSAFGNSAFFGGGSYDSTVLTSGPRLVTRGEAGLEYTRPRTQTRVAYSKNKEDARDVGAGERDYDEFRVFLTRTFTPRVNGTAYGLMTNEDFSGITSDIKEKALGGLLTVEFGRALGLDMRVERRWRDRTTAGFGFHELAAGVYLRYGVQRGAAPLAIQ